jgi:AraC-like DNA-binding protein
LAVAELNARRVMPGVGLRNECPTNVRHSISATEYAMDSQTLSLIYWLSEGFPGSFSQGCDPYVPLQREHDGNMVLDVRSTFVCILGLAQGMDGPMGKRTPRQVRRVLTYVHDHLADTLTLDVLARQLDLSPYYFARMFRLATSESPHQCVIRQRLARAQHLLCTTTMQLVDIALSCGFADQSSFTTVFKRHLGVTPGVYRRHMQ